LISERATTHSPTRHLYVGDLRYGNSAAKFWPALIEEAKQVAPSTAVIRISGACAGELDPVQLFPEVWLKEDLQSLLESDLEQVIRQTAAELELTGPPAAVRVQLIDKEDAVTTDAELPLDCIDADLMPYFLAWLLRWAGIEKEKWNREFVSGSFAAEDRENNRTYRFSFALRNRYLSEGLYTRMCDLYI
jgi:hypothetical protein